MELGGGSQEAEAYEEIEQVKDKIGELEEEVTNIKKEIVKVRRGGKDGVELLLHRQLAADHEQLVELRKKEIFLRDSARSETAKQSLGDMQAMVEEACARAIKRAKASEEISLSSVGPTEWQLISEAYELKVEIVDLVGDSLRARQGFCWSDEPENQQSDRYMAYLNTVFPLSPRLVWLEGENRKKGLLNFVEQSGRLHYSKIKGNVDAAIVTRASVSLDLESAGLCIVYELKKVVDRGYVCQAMCRLLLANLKSRTWRPVVVVTNLQEDWRLLWMDGTKLMMGRSDPGTVISIVKSIISSLVTAAEVGAKAPGIPGEVAQSPTTASGIIDIIARRQPVPQHGGAAIDTSLADLEGLIPEEELKAAHAHLMLQQLLNQPFFF